MNAIRSIITALRSYQIALFFTYKTKDSYRECLTEVNLADQRKKSGNVK